MIKQMVTAPVEFSGTEDVIVTPLFQGTRRLEGPAKKLDVLCRSGLSDYIRKTRFSAKAGETALIGFAQRKAPRHVLLVGLGDRATADPVRMLDAGAAASNAIASRGFRSCHLLIDVLLNVEPEEAILRAFLKGFLLSLYSFSIKAPSESKPRTSKLVVATDSATRSARAINTARVVADCATFVRDLVNRPGDDVTPTRMAKEAKRLAKRHGFECRVMGRTELGRMRMGALLAVARGSAQEPRLIALHYNRGSGSRRGYTRICLVGKGVTFDSGGLSIKSWQNMNEMKGDMAGGAVVVGAVAAASRLRLPVEIVGLVPCVENMPDGVALRPGDIVTTYSGKTIEVISTDAEGRLILADILAYAQRFKPELIVDVATLTGSVSIALGTRIAGLVGNDQGLIDRMVAAGVAAAEPVWPLPLNDHFKEMIKGDISDYKNLAGRDGGTITAAALLSEFVGSTPWIHIDIAGTFWSQDAKGPYRSKGATGFGLDLMLSFLESFALKKPPRRSGNKREKR
jgi:leucyl aminopeptidase